MLELKLNHVNEMAHCKQLLHIIDLLTECFLGFDAAFVSELCKCNGTKVNEYVPELVQVS